MSFEAGYDKGVKFTPTGTSGIELNITGWTWAEEVNKLDVTNTGTSGIQALIAGVLRGDCNITANLDGDFMPNDFSMRAGIKGVILASAGRFSVSGVIRRIQIPVMVIKVNYESKVDGLVSWNCDASLDFLSGTYIRIV
jgi:hypothetical protein